MSETPTSTVAQIVQALAEDVSAGALPAGAHLSAQRLADRFGVSRFPIGQALRVLADHGVVTPAPRRGFFVAQEGQQPAGVLAGGRKPQGLAAVYFAIAEDRVAGRLPDTMSEAALRERYGVTRGQLAQLLDRIAAEGWAERRAGYGWRFSSVLTTPDALEQTYRLRLAIEPASLLEPGYRLDPAVAAQCRAVEETMLAGSIETASSDALYERGVRYHEAIVGASGNPFMLEALQRVNRVRRLLVYRSLTDRQRFYRQAREHLAMLDLLEAGRREEAAAAMRVHLGAVMQNLSAVRPLLETGAPPDGKP
ncbi:GntR family transcriptional regulator [Roseomonas aerophila]|uniref:GntR family transcriptional regulator n=1 Tax=Teichococcus aerophilus TaxID=1224513 RepID=A0ABR7RJ80_9PROT|nr:GntR family transcriptional regulator [Pseudoroseomonas aerophila]MBC9206371.1 GntR family transcriptional regulator [Pseudoroseomonas aerophila]